MRYGMTTHGTMRSGIVRLAGAAALAATLSVTSAYAQKKYDPGMKRYFSFMAKYYPEGDKNSNFNIYGYSTAELLTTVLKMCGDNLTRENVMKQAASLKHVTGDLALPGMEINTSPTDYRVNKQLQMMRFDGERWELFGPVLEDHGAAG